MSVEELTEAERASYRDGYEWVDDAAFVVANRCERCASDLVEWTEEVPCCGPEYECFDVLYVYACRSCKLVGDRW
jgi:hypothetical protein